MKDSERKRRTDKVPIEYSSVEQSSQLPKDMDTFWPTNNNKLLMEKMIYNHLRSNVPPTEEYATVLGQVTKEDESSEWQCISMFKGKEQREPHLQSTFEEADLRIPLHVLDIMYVLSFLMILM